MSKLAYASLFVLILLFCILPVGSVSAASTPVSGLITQDTTWTQANSPYQLTGPVGVASGVTLTVESGVTVDLSNYYIHVNGTLIAKGTSDQEITLDSHSPEAYLSLAAGSTNWTEQTGTGCIMQNANINAIMFIGNSPKIDCSHITGHRILISGSPTISNSVITSEIHILSGAPSFIGNTINNYIVGDTIGPVILSTNKISGSFSDVIDGAGVCCPNIIATDNIITHFQKGILLFAGNSTIQRNVIAYNTVGIQLGLSGSGTCGLFSVNIQNNLITGNSKGISMTGLSQTLAVGSIEFVIVNNNIENNPDYNIYLGMTAPLNATYNWWGTTDAQAINQTIYDSKNDYNLGTVTFDPYLAAPDPTALTYNGEPQSTCTPMPGQTTPDSTGQTPSPEKSITGGNQQVGLSSIEFTVIIVFAVVAGLAVAMLLAHKSPKSGLSRHR